MKTLFANVPGLLAHRGSAPSAARQGMLLAAFCLAAGAMMFPEVAMASGNITLKSGQSVGSIANNAKSSLSGFAVIITYVAYIAALVFTFSALLKFKAYSEHPDRTELKVPLTLLALAAGFAAIGEVLGTGIASIWGTGMVQLVPTI